MSVSEFLRREAESCLRTARGCFDLTSAEQMRIIAAELAAKATEIDVGPEDRRLPHRRTARFLILSRNK